MEKGGVNHPNFCYCGKASKILTSWTERNPGRRFQVCSIPKGGCGFWQWHDPEMCPRATILIPGLLRKIDRLQSNKQENDGDDSNARVHSQPGPKDGSQKSVGDSNNSADGWSDWLPDCYSSSLSPSSEPTVSTKSRFNENGINSREILGDAINSRETLEDGIYSRETLEDGIYSRETLEES